MSFFFYYSWICSSDHLFSLLALITKVTRRIGSVIYWWVALRGDKLDTGLFLSLLSLGVVLGVFF